VRSGDEPYEGGKIVVVVEHSEEYGRSIIVVHFDTLRYPPQLLAKNPVAQPEHLFLLLPGRNRSDGIPRIPEHNPRNILLVSIK